MSKSIGARDVLQVPSLAHLTEIAILHPSQDKLVAPVIHALGIDTDFPVEIHANKYRDMNGKVAIGYRFVGHLRIDRGYINSGFADTIERVAATGYSDPSLTRELAEMMGQTVDFKSFHEGETEELSEEEFPVSMMEEDYASSEDLITTLNVIVNRVRGGTNIIDYSAIDF